MHVRTMTAAGAVLLVSALAGCSSGGHTSSKTTMTPASPSAAPPSAAPSTRLTFGGTYTWPDGVKVSVTGARVFTDFNTADGESPAPGATDFRVTLRVTNGGKTPVDLGGLSVIVQGATNGGAAASGTFERGSAPLEGQLAPGVTATKNDDESLGTQYGRRVAVRVQRVSYDPSGATWPEFTGTVTG